MTASDSKFDRVAFHKSSLTGFEVRRFWEYMVLRLKALFNIAWGNAPGTLPRIESLNHSLPAYDVWLDNNDRHQPVIKLPRISFPAHYERSCGTKLR